MFACCITKALFGSSRINNRPSSYSGKSRVSGKSKISLSAQRVSLAVGGPDPPWRRIDTAINEEMWRTIVKDMFKVIQQHCKLRLSEAQR